MNPINHLLEWRLDIFLKKYNIDLNDFCESEKYLARTYALRNIAKQLVPCNSCNNSERKKYINYGFWLIKGVIWKNIINYTLIVDTNSYECKLCITRIYNNQRVTINAINRKWMNRDILLNKLYTGSFSDDTVDKLSYDNLNKLWFLIISYLMLTDAIITISDISNIIKELIYNIMLIKN